MDHAAMLLAVLSAGWLVAAQEQGELPDDIRAMLKDTEPIANPRPIVLIPGFASSRLRSYSTTDCPGNLLDFNLHDDVWLDVAKVLGTKSCFLHCMGLDPETAADPTDPDCRVRPDQGLDAITELNPGVITGPLSVVWKELINLLLELGFEPEKTLLVAPYDFRIAPRLLERRDAYFTRLKQTIENAVRMDQARFRRLHPTMSSRFIEQGVMVIAHSMGNSIFRYFEAWLMFNLGVEEGKAWMEAHINTYIAVGAPILGAQFGVQASMSGLTFGLPISEYDARTFSVGFSSTGMCLPMDPDIADPRHMALNGGSSKYPIPVAYLNFANGTKREYTPTDGVWNHRLWGHVQEFDSWGRWPQHHIETLYDDDPVLDFLKAWRRPHVENVHCAYGINRKTPVGFEFEKPDNGYEHDWDTVRTLYEEGSRVYDDNGAELSSSARASGDGTVAYYSLSWCHTWISGRQNISRVPQKAMYELDEIQIFENTTTEEFLVADKKDRPGDLYNTFFEERAFDGKRFTATSVWELDNVDHRAVIKDPVFLKHLSHQLHEQNNVVGQMETQLEKTIESMMRALTMFPTHKRKPIPTTDDGCLWDYYHAHCKYPQWCGYYYKFGDYLLDHSCRLHRLHAGKAEAKYAAAHESPSDGACECVDGTCYLGICKYKSECKGAGVIPDVEGFFGPCPGNAAAGQTSRDEL